MTQHVGHHESDVIAQLHRKIATLERERDEALEALRKLEKTATAVLLHKMERERDEALAALRVIAEGGPERERATIYRADGVHSKHDECKHDLAMWQDCAACIGEYAANFLAKHEDKS